MKMNYRSTFFLVLLMLFLCISCCLPAAAADVSLTRTISPLSIDNAGGSFDVVVEIEIANGDATVGTLSENYQFAENMPDWTISNIDADPVFIQYVDGMPGLYEWSGGFTPIPAGIYYINYTMTIGDPEQPGTYDVSGSWVDIDNADGITVTGDTQVTIVGIPVFTSTDWEQFQGGLYNNGVTSDRGPIQKPDVTESWATYTYGVPMAYGIDTVSLVVGDLVYSVTQGAVYAVDRNTGEIAWTGEIETGPTAPLGAPAYGNGKLFATAFGHVYAFDAITGTELWNDSINTEDPSICQINTPVTYDDGRIYFGEWLSYGDDDRKYYCYNEDGTERWTRNSSTKVGYYRAGAAIIGQYLVYPDDAMHMTSVDKYDGTTVDEVDMADLLGIGVARNEIRASVMYDPLSKRLYTATEDGYCISIGFKADGTFDTSDAHKFDIGKSTSTPTLYNGRVYVGTGTFTGHGELYCLNAEDLTQVWNYTPNGGVQASPVISTAYDDGDGEVYIYFTTNILNGTAYCLKDYTGNTEAELQWTYQPQTEHNEYTLPGVTIKDGRIFYGNDHGYLFGLAEWNFWDDPISEEGEAITTSELQEAVHHWLTDEPAPVTGSIISTERLQNLVHNWLIS